LGCCKIFQFWKTKNAQQQAKYFYYHFHRK
jgi:hypothetical protein